eukprot:9069863-Pyramimonas_sp.AAC.1
MSAVAHSRGQPRGTSAQVVRIIGHRGASPGSGGPTRRGLDTDICSTRKQLTGQLNSLERDKTA